MVGASILGTWNCHWLNGGIFTMTMIYDCKLIELNGCSTTVHKPRLSVFTIAFACSCTFGGVLYDSAGWTGIALYHIILQGAMTLLLAVEPACRQSFRAVFFPGSEDEAVAAQNAENGDADPAKDEIFTHVVPRPSTEQKKARSTDLPGALPGVVEEEMKVEDVEEATEATEVAEVAQGETNASLKPDQTVLECLGRKGQGTWLSYISVWPAGRDIFIIYIMTTDPLIASFLCIFLSTYIISASQSAQPLWLWRNCYDLTSRRHSKGVRRVTIQYSFISGSYPDQNKHRSGTI